jgi:hypothetical protein
LGVLAILLAHKILSCLLGSQKEKLSAQKHYNTPKRHGINNFWVLKIDGTADSGNDLLNFSKLPIFSKRRKIIKSSFSIYHIKFL